MAKSVRIEDGHAVIRIPLEQVHGLQVALAPCPCRAVKSEATTATRRGLEKALAQALARMSASEEIEREKNEPSEIS